MRARDLLNDAIRTLKASEANDHWQASRERIEAEELLGFVLGREPNPKEDVPGRQARRFLGYVDRRARGEPVPYIKGFTDFRGLDHLARQGVFVPRDSSEFLAEQAI